MAQISPRLGSQSTNLRKHSPLQHCLGVPYRSLKCLHTILMLCRWMCMPLNSAPLSSQACNSQFQCWSRLQSLRDGRRAAQHRIHRLYQCHACAGHAPRRKETCTETRHEVRLLFWVRVHSFSRCLKSGSTLASSPLGAAWVR